MRCHFENLALGPVIRSTRCSGPVNVIAHDRRGCRVVCEAHANFLAQTSLMMGHSVNCPSPTEPWARITKLG